MLKKDENRKPSRSKSLTDRIVPILRMADRLGPINQDTDQKALSDWICGDDEPSNSNEAEASETQEDSICPAPRFLLPGLTKACDRFDQIDGRLRLFNDNMVKNSDVRIATFTANLVTTLVAALALWLVLWF